MSHELPWRERDFGAAAEHRRRRRMLAEGQRQRLTWLGLALVVFILAASALGQ